MGKQALGGALTRLGAGMVACTLLGCSGAARLSGGPVVSYVPNERPTNGAEFLASAATGLGDEGGFGAVEAAARVQATKHAQLFTYGLGPAWFGVPRKSLLTLDFTPMLGLERIDDKLIALTSVRGGGGFGLALSHEESRRAPLWAHGGTQTTYEEVVVDETALTLEVVGGIDVPATRDAQFSMGLLFGLAWVTTRYKADVPGPGAGGWRHVLRPRPRNEMPWRPGP